MAMARPARDTSPDHDPEKPNHMIIWLDATIGNPTEYIHLKKAFATNIDPRHEASMMLTDTDYNRLLLEEDAVEVKFEGVTFLLHAFINEDKCLEAFEKNQNKRIFFITSGQMGKNIVPKIIEQYRHTFTDLITNQAYPSVYIFCHNIEWNLEWAIEYIDYIQMFNFDSELLERMTRDIAEYFIECGNRIREANDLYDARRHFHWAKKLWHQYDKMQQQISTDNPREVRPSVRMNQINALIAEIDALLPRNPVDDENSNSDDDTKFGESTG